MDRKNRKDNRIPSGLSFLMWPALVRAPWLMDSFNNMDERRAAEHRRKNRR